MREIDVWWHGIAALPASRDDHNYHVLRRVWGDHTMSGNRGFYRVGAEDHITASLFQTWAALSEPEWVETIIAHVGGVLKGRVKRVRWAYECNEFLDAKLQPFHKRNFIIPDIMLIYEDEGGTGLIAFEAKKPGKAVDLSDSRKLLSYTDLPSTRNIERRYGCVLVSDEMVTKSNRACEGRWPILSWERLMHLQMQEAEKMELPRSTIEKIVTAIRRHFSRYGVGSQFEMRVGDYDIKQQYDEIDALAAPDCVRRFLKGSECLEAVWSGYRPAPPLAWLASEPSALQIRQRSHQGGGWQTNADRMVCRWSFDWEPICEHPWQA